ncbi:MAG: transposase family protein, partial [Proteobacteria bacterium]|nr:transposase family protein [Pseudomonadota bacterium]
MAYREVTMIEVKEVLRQWLSGFSRKTMARWVGLDRNTIRRYLLVAQQCGLHAADGVDALTDEKLSEILAALGAGPGRPHGEGWAICEKHREKIAGFIKDRIRLTKGRKLLLRQGIDVSYPTLHRFAISELGFGKRRLTIPVADCGPGEELQLDTGRMGLLEPGEDGKRRHFKAFIFTSVLTRHRFVYPVFTEQTVDAIEACEVAWEYFGGIFRVIIPDNTKAIVNIPDPLDPGINITFQEYSQRRGFFIDPARIRAPQDKGRVERAV